MENIEAAMKRIPPHSTEAEQAVLGAMLMNKDAITVTSEILAGQDFYQTAYGILFDAMTDLFKSGRPVDLITLQEYLKTKDVPPEVSSMEFARDLLVGTQTSANVKYYAEIVKEKSVLRSLIKLNEETANACYLENELALNLFKIACFCCSFQTVVFIRENRIRNLICIDLEVIKRN